VASKRWPGALAPAIIPLTLFVVSVLLYLNTRSLVKTAIVLLAVHSGRRRHLVPLPARLQHEHRRLVGLIALLASTPRPRPMLLYLDLAYEATRAGRLRTLADLQETIVEGAAKRLRPKP
jgi:Cu(I)/Ag(I) efflux system membrane protein CusA/SilA